MPDVLAAIKCPNGHSDMGLRLIVKHAVFRGENISYSIEAFVCPECGLQIGTIEQTAKAQGAISEALGKR